MSNLSSPRVLHNTIRLLLGVFFIGTAVLKLLSIDNFELYIYSFGIFSYTWTTFLSRSLIFIELIIGISLIFKICFKKTWWLTLLMM
ncbi:MAG: DoxX family membrane protein, partial [Bacteroidales bacterium]|nr:DoxX family membrane protein [Bacteroidales bacterium]